MHTWKQIKDILRKRNHFKNYIIRCIELPQKYCVVYDRNYKNKQIYYVFKSKNDYKLCKKWLKTIPQKNFQPAKKYIIQV